MGGTYLFELWRTVSPIPYPSATIVAGRDGTCRGRETEVIAFAK
jgi:hypothetical protein